MQRCLFIVLLMGIHFCASHLYSDEETEVCIDECASCCEEATVLITPYASIAFGKTIGVDHSYSTLGLWVVAANPDNLFFVDGSWDHLCTGQNGGNLGAGVRFGDQTRGCGINLYGDWLSRHSKNLYQVSSGIEAWLCPWEFKINVYLPTKNRFTVDQKLCTYTGGYEFKSKTKIFACQLATLLVGRRFDLSNCYLKNLSFLASAGPYWISHSKDKNRYGFLTNLDFSIYNIFSWKTLVSYDPIFKTRVDTILSVSIPLGCDLAEIFCRFYSSFYDRPDRFNIISTDKKDFCHHNW